VSEPPVKKDTWDRLTALATILIPAAIALAGHFIAQGLKQAEIESQERRAEQDRALTKANTRIAQASLINTMMKFLTSTSPQERRLAVEAVLIALPEEGPALARTVAQSDENKEVQAAAKSSIEQRVSSLLQDMFSSDGTIRKTAAQELIQGWRNDSATVFAVVEYALEHKTNDNGIYNSIVVLAEFSPRALAQARSRVVELAIFGKTVGAKTDEKATILLQRVGA
jgi:hypothetical protein